MDFLTLFGLTAVTAMLDFLCPEDLSPWFILAFAAACALASIYGFLQGAWPFGVVEAIWAARRGLPMATPDAIQIRIALLGTAQFTDFRFLFRLILSTTRELR